MGYTIKQVSQLTGLSISTLRYYDREGLLPRAAPAGVRLAAVQAALEHSREILEFHEIAAETGSEAEAAALYAGRRGNK